METAEPGPSILRSEAICTLRKLKPGKAAGPDEVYSEILKAFDEEGIDMIWWLIAKIYET